MTEAISHLNFLAILAAVVASFFLGGLWFVAIIGKKYAVAMGRENLPPEKPTPMYIFGPVA